MGSAQDNGELERFRQQLKGFATWGSILAPVLLLDCLSDLLRREGTLTVYHQKLKLFGYSEAVKHASIAPYGSLDPRNLELLCAAEELGRVLVTYDQVPKGIPEDILLLAGQEISDIADELPENRQAHNAACRAVGWFALSFNRKLDLPLPDMIREYVKASIFSARYHAERAAELTAESTMRTQLPPVSSVITDPYKDTIFVISRNRFNPRGLVIRAEKPNRLGNDFLKVSFSGMISGGKEPCYDGSYIPPPGVEVLPFFEVGQIASSLLVGMGLMPSEAAAFYTDGSNPVGLHYVVQDILEQVDNGGKVRISGEKLATWVASCNASLASGHALSHSQAVQLPLIDLTQLQPEPGAGWSGLQ